MAEWQYHATVASLRRFENEFPSPLKVQFSCTDRPRPAVNKGYDAHIESSRLLKGSFRVLWGHEFAHSLHLQGFNAFQTKLWHYDLAIFGESYEINSENPLSL